MRNVCLKMPVKSHFSLSNFNPRDAYVPPTKKYVNKKQKRKRNNAVLHVHDGQLEVFLSEQTCSISNNVFMV